MDRKENMPKKDNLRKILLKKLVYQLDQAMKTIFYVHLVFKNIAITNNLFF